MPDFVQFIPVIAAGVAAIGSILSSNKNKKAAGKVAKAQVQSSITDQETEVLREKHELALAQASFKASQISPLPQTAAFSLPGNAVLYASVGAVILALIISKK